MTPPQGAHNHPQGPGPNTPNPNLNPCCTHGLGQPPPVLTLTHGLTSPKPNPPWAPNQGHSITPPGIPHCLSPLHPTPTWGQDPPPRGPGLKHTQPSPDPPPPTPGDTYPNRPRAHQPLHGSTQRGRTTHRQDPNPNPNPKNNKGQSAVPSHTEHSSHPRTYDLLFTRAFEHADVSSAWPTSRLPN